MYSAMGGVQVPVTTLPFGVRESVGNRQNMEMFGAAAVTQPAVMPAVVPTSQSSTAQS